MLALLAAVRRTGALDDCDVTLSRTARVLLAVRGPGSACVVVYVPLVVVIVVNSFNTDRAFAWPPPGLTLHWWTSAWQTPGVRAALLTSVEVGLGATALALAARHRWPRSRSRGTGSSGSDRCPWCWCCRSRCPAS